MVTWLCHLSWIWGDIFSRNREQDNEISLLKQHQEQLLADNSQLREHFNQKPTATTATDEDKPPLSLSELPQLQYQYQQILEKGLWVMWYWCVCSSTYCTRMKPCTFIMPVCLCVCVCLCVLGRVAVLWILQDTLVLQNQLMNLIRVIGSKEPEKLVHM